MSQPTPTAWVQDDAVVSSRCDANGNGRLPFRTTGRETYRVTQVSHNGTITNAIAVGAAARCGLFKNGVLVSPTVAQGSTIAGDPPIWLRGQDVMELRYSGATPFAAIEMMVIYDRSVTGR